ncbi:ABC transporter substrate-binding protein [candidate division KSB3 bacterium]|uniref:ABC transporter substrate-binding protein n=1 Tax=candidate division KSB3 bacterium TaxID=2044937 RepID=A0A2G6E573_9BACT|nr:MAG: ABC transporter substrate-binding protein [candidate division KSB3 bacterium]PIE29772.1 MAG: ABC transporter substrate-binding protein [candidate division KSB3 bacterium]
MKHSILLLAVWGITLFSIVSFADDRPVLNVYNWDDYIDDKTIPEFEDAFGVKVNYDVYDSNESLLAKLQAGASGFDVIFPSDYMVEIMIQLGLLEPLDKRLIPNMALLDPAFLNQAFDPENQYSLPFTWGTAGIGYRSDMIEEPVDSWDVMFNPKYAGHIVMLDDVRESLGAALKFLGFSLNSTNPDELELARDLLITQKAFIKAYVSAQGEQMLVSGDAWLVHNWNGDIYRVAAEDPTIHYVIPKEGTSKFIDNCAIPKKAQNKELAHAFINFLLDPEVDARIHNQIQYLTPNTAAWPLLDKRLRSAMEAMTPEIADKLEFIEELGRETRLWDKTWTEIKAH